MGKRKSEAKGGRSIGALTAVERVALHAELLNGAVLREVSGRYGVTFRNVQKYVQNLGTEHRLKITAALRTRSARRTSQLSPALYGHNQLMLETIQPKPKSSG